MTQSDSIVSHATAAGVPVSDSVVSVKATRDTVQARRVTREVMPTAGAGQDTVSADTVKTLAKEYGLLLEPPVIPEVKENPPISFGMSYILGGIAILFFVIGLRFRNNRKYITAMLRNLVEVRVRNNVFDETVRETSFLVLLNLLWSCSAGMILWGVLGFTLPGSPDSTMYLPSLDTRQAASVGVCMGVMTVYTCLMAVGYTMVGSVFSDGKHARLWLKGFTAGQGLLSFVYLPLSLLLLFYPEWTEILLWIALGTFLLAKIVFIWKGFRIFFTQISSWVLFLYYLCSLEIVPLILTYLAAWWLCSLL